MSLYFNPIKLVLLIGWFYLCAYLAQRVQFSALVVKERRPIASFLTLIFGPLLILLLLIVDVCKHKSEDERGVIAIIQERVSAAFNHIRSATFSGREDKDMIELLDSSGRNIKEIYGHSKGKRRDSHILNVTRDIIFNALQEDASDILIDPKDNSTHELRFRVDGMLRTIEYIETQTSQAVINSIKAISNMDIAEKRRPQDGAFVANTVDGSVFFRVVSAGVIHGEKLSIRILNQKAGLFTLDSVGLTKKQQVIIEKEIEKPSSMILMCGPTGSGKTTTLYSMLNQIDLFTRNVVTVEDPVEYTLANASQIEVNPKAGITFAKTLRSILRQDPDVICVGEIRDEETAATALRASQTGHLVLATLHCNSNATALVRLLDLGVSSLLMASGLNLLISQRLLRRLCEYCKIPAELTPAQIREFRKKKVNYRNVYQAVGCEECYNTGYRGRIAIFDILLLNDQMKEEIANNKILITELRKSGDKKGKSNLYKQGLKKVVSGITSLQELKRVVG